MNGKLALADLGATLDALSWQWLCDTHPILAESIEGAVEKGVWPAQIRRFVMQRTHRLELALRCEQAARYLEPVRED